MTKKLVKILRFVDLMPPARKVKQYDLDWKFVAEFETVGKAMIAIDKPPGSHLRQRILSEKPYAGFLWRYSDQIILENDEIFQYLSKYNLEISNYGTVRTKAGYLTKGSKIGDYYRLCLGKRGNPAIHVMVATAFIPNPENKPTVNHKIKVREGGTNHVSNLEWFTHKEQAIHRDNKNLPL